MPRRPRASRLLSLVVLLLPLLLCATGRAEDDARGARAAPHVVFRTPRDLHAAFEVASYEA